MLGKAIAMGLVHTQRRLPRAAFLSDDPKCLYLEGRIFFANAQNISEQILPLVEQVQPRVMVLDLSRVFDLEYTALKMLIEAEERHRSRGVLLYLAGLNPETLSIIRKSSLGTTLGDERMFFNVAEAVRHYSQERSHPAI